MTGTSTSTAIFRQIAARLQELRQRGVRWVRIINLHPAAFVPAYNLVFVPSDMTNAYREGRGEFSLPNKAHRVNAREGKPLFFLQLVERNKTHVAPRSLWCRIHIHGFCEWPF